MLGLERAQPGYPQSKALRHIVEDISMTREEEYPPGVLVQEVSNLKSAVLMNCSSRK